MVEEIKLELNRTRKKQDIEILSYIDSEKAVFSEPGFDLYDFDYYTVIERNEEFGVILCWDEGDEETYVKVYRVRFNK